LKQVVAVMSSNPKIKIQVQGHTDSRGSARYNLKLSQRRTRSVRRYLINKGGIDGSRLTAKGYGESKPIATNRTRKGRAKNRRVEFHIK
jgi:OOP family OmpA-OmpF porin